MGRGAYALAACLRRSPQPTEKASVCFRSACIIASMELTDQVRHGFLEMLWSYYAEAGRDSLPWRQPDTDGTFDPYKILVSELMLQQTQVLRVIPKYHDFLVLFSSVQDLAQAELGDVLRAWQGLGYNRRAKFLWQAAQQVASAGSFPTNIVELVKLPGIGSNTAGAILTYAFNQPVAFVETNVRTVYIHHFFAGRDDISDKEILTLLDQTLDHENPRQFYWALMDYGSHLKATIGNLNKASKHYAKQSRFEGSRRQVRGQVLRMLGTSGMSHAELQTAIADERLEAVLHELLGEGLIRRNGNQFIL
jgi:A/G-specific adenine glycosylase